MPGIMRINIKSDWDDRRTQMSRNYAPLANEIYRKHFSLADDDEYIHVTKDEALARYDWKEGIDVILTTVHGTRMTLQEKFLNWWQSTATFEETKTSGEPGAWYYCTAQYYFVGYIMQYWDKDKKCAFYEPRAFRDYMCLDLPAIHRMDEVGTIEWEFDQNRHDGRRGRFRYMKFSDVPQNCIIFAAPNWTVNNIYSKPTGFSQGAPL